MFAWRLDGLQADVYVRPVRRPLPRAFRRQLEAEDAEKLERILAKVGERLEAATAAGATAPGDGRRLRGIPVVGRSTAGGAIEGTDPVKALLAKESRRRRS